MLSSLIRSAKSISVKPLKVKEELLPSLVLYRRLLRVHRKVLPLEMRVMGDEYVKAEFRRTRKTDNPLHLVGFLSEWKKYLLFHEDQLVVQTQEALQFAIGEKKGGEGEGVGEKVMEGARERVREGKKLQDELFEKLSADQLGQLYELLQATKEIYSDPVASPTDAEGVPIGETLPDLGGTKKE